jgi:hypothetical protein
LYHSTVNIEEKFINIKLIIKHTKKYCIDYANIVIENGDELDVYEFGNESDLVKFFSVEGKLYYDTNRVKSSLSSLLPNKQCVSE